MDGNGISITYRTRIRSPAPPDMDRPEIDSEREATISGIVATTPETIQTYLKALRTTLDPDEDA